MQIGGVVLLSACGAATAAGAMDSVVGSLGVTRQGVQGMWAMFVACMLLSLVSLWWGLGDLRGVQEEWDDVSGFLAPKREGKGQREKRRRAGTAPLHNLQMFLATYRRAEVPPTLETCVARAPLAASDVTR